MPSEQAPVRAHTEREAEVMARSRELAEQQALEAANERTSAEAALAQQAAQRTEADRAAEAAAQVRAEADMRALQAAQAREAAELAQKAQADRRTEAETQARELARSRDSKPNRRQRRLRLSAVPLTGRPLRKRPSELR